MKRWFLIALLILAACAAPQSKPSMIKEITEEAVKYSTDTSPENMEAYKADCEQRGGTFDECGPSCSPDAEFCAQVCTPTCMLKLPEAEHVVQDVVQAEDVAQEQNVEEQMAQEADASGPQIHDVQIEDFKFKPKVLTIKAGDTVRWTNLGPSTHSATADGGTFDSLLLGKGQTFMYKFDTPGLYQYHCTPHRSMRASITVEVN